jgi:hypothetical protein
MTDRNKFEEMLELLINEDKEGAEALFHEIVVEKSRDIYEALLEDDEEVEEASDEEVDESEDEEVDESEDEDLEESAEDEEVDESEDDDLDEMFGLDEFEAEADPMDPMAAMGGDATDDMMGDVEMGGDEEGEEEGGADDAFADLEAALDALKAEFEAMMGDEEGPEMDDDEEGEEEEGDDDAEKEAFAFEAEDEDDDDDEVEESRQPKTAGEQMREYVEKVSAKMGDNGTNTKSIVAGKNDMGGTAANILQAGTDAGVEANKGQLKGNGVLKGSVKDMNTKNVNVVGAKAATKMTAQPGHGAEKKGKPETADKSAGSMLNGAPKRAK